MCGDGQTRHHLADTSGTVLKHGIKKFRFTATLTMNILTLRRFSVYLYSKCFTFKRPVNETIRSSIDSSRSFTSWLRLFRTRDELLQAGRHFQIIHNATIGPKSVKSISLGIILTKTLKPINGTPAYRKRCKIQTTNHCIM